MRMLLGALVVFGMVGSSVPSFARLAITEVASTSGAPAGALAGLDWWELTNTGPDAVLLDGYAWEDRPVVNDRSIFPSGISIAAGESIIIHENLDTSVAAEFRSAWALPSSVRVLEESLFTGSNTFSGLSSGGDDVHLFDKNGIEVAAVVFGASTSGVTFEWDGQETSLGLSVNGENGAYLSSYGGVGSPGIASIPEPTSLSLAAMGLGLFLASRRSQA